MDKSVKEMTATIDDELKVFVRSSPQELESAELDRIAGGEGSHWVPDG